MGTSSLTMHLTPTEINNECIKNSFLVTKYNKFKNEDGYITLKEMERLTEKMIEKNILKKIIQITTSTKQIIMWEDFKYIYALFYTENTEAKLNFILDFIFFNKKPMTKEVYIHRVKKYFLRNQLIVEILINEKLFDDLGINKGKDIERIKVFGFIKDNSYDQFTKFKFMKEINSNDDKRNENECTCLIKNNSNIQLNTPITKYNPYDALHKEFEIYEKNNNGIFPIKLLVTMFNDINIKQSLINLISTYLHKKTQKSFINFELFKHLYYLLTLDQLEESLFELLSYPKKEIKKNDLFLFIKSTKKEITSKQINDYFTEIDIKDTITKEKFKAMISLINKDLLDSFEHIKYLQYIHFKIKCPDKSTEKNCIEILMKKKTFGEALKDQGKYEDVFFIIDATFWKKWSEHVSNTIKTNKKHVRINTNKISDRHGRLHEGLVYIKDYIVIGQKMYNLFVEWYGHAYEGDLKRTKIFFSDEKNNNDNKLKCNRSIYREDSPFCGIDIHCRKYEIEVFPVFLLFFNFEELSTKYESINEIKENLIKSSMENQYENSTYTAFSRRSKFIDFMKPLEESTNMKLDKNATRFWVFHQGKFYMVTDMNKTLEEDNILISCIVILETTTKSTWPSEKYFQSNNISSTNNSNNNSNNNENSNERIIKQAVGLMNIGNTCYMNAVLQTFLNNNELKDVMLYAKQIDFMLSRKRGAKLMKEMMNLFKEKYQSDKRCITPRRFKEICGEYNEAFSDYDEQDAYDFFTFLVDSLHEDINLKGLNTKIETVDKIIDPIDIREQGNIQWANNLRNNLSYLHSIFLGQLKSELICTKCQNAKVSYETFSSLSLPIPEDMILMLDIYLFRLPFTAKVYYADINPHVKANKPKEESIHLFLKNIRKKSLGLYIKDKNQMSNLLSINHTNEPKKKYDPLTTAYYEQETKTKNDNDTHFTNAMNMNIPYKLRIEVNRKDKCSEIIKKLKDIKDLELEQDTNNQYTMFMITNQDKYADLSLTIDECFNNGQDAYVYELLTSKGIHKLYDYPNINSTANILHKELIPLMLQKDNIIPSSKQINNNQEVIIMINHRLLRSEALSSQNKFFCPNLYEYINSFKDYIILSSNDAIKTKNLYNFIWEKYEYFLNNPTKYEEYLWWKKKPVFGSMNNSRINTISNNQNQGNMIRSPQSTIGNNNQHQDNNEVLPLNNNNNNNSNYCKKKNCMPFILRLVNKQTLACLTCPWYQFCSGCILNPSETSLLQINLNTLLIVEWCRDIYIKEIDPYKNYKLTINDPNIEANLSSLHMTSRSSFSIKTEKEQETITLNDCLKLFTESEEVNDVYCEVCSCKSSFKKKYEIERLPKYLVFTLKRFKYTALYKKKITTLINFPIIDLDLSNFLSSNSINAPKNTKSNIDLYAMINHCGSLTEGHYSSIINSDEDSSKWLKYDDSKVSEYNESLHTSSVYMLIYKVHSNIRINALSENHDRLYFNYDGLLFTAYKLFIQKQIPGNIFNFNYINESIEDGKVKEVQGEALYYYGEPVNTIKGKGYLVNVYERQGRRYAKVKKDIGYVDVILDNVEGYAMKESIIIEIIKDNEKLKRFEENGKVSAKGADCGCIVF